MTTRRLTTLILFIALFAMAVRETMDPDMWWHLRTGQVVLEQGVPQTDLFSYTVPHHDWIVQQWLTDVLMWLVYRAVGFGGLMLLFAAAVSAAFWFVYSVSAGRPYLAAFVTLLAFLAAALPMGVRPQMFNVFFLALFIHLLEGYKDGRYRRRTLYLLPFLTLLWANMHSGFLAGVALLAVYAGGEGVGLFLGPRDERNLQWPDVRLLALLAVAGLAASLINPHGYRLTLFPLFTLGSSAIQQNILEWRSPDFHSPYFWFFGLTLAMGVLGWLWSPRRPTWTELLLFGGTAAAGLLSARHIPLFAVTAVPIIARHWQEALAETRLAPLLGPAPTLSPSRALVATNWMLLFLILFGATIWVADRLAGNAQTIEARFPVAAVDFLEESGLAQGRVYNHYDWGGYLIWRGIPVFVDGRTEVYGDDFFRTYLLTFNLDEQWRQPLDDFAVDYVLMKRTSPLATLLAVSPEWDERYADDVARIFVRAGAAMEERQ
jgi:hypothetical protein